MSEVFPGHRVASLSGIKYPTINDWATQGVLEPELRAATGTGSRRRYSFHDVVAAKVAGRFRRIGVRLQYLRRIISLARWASKEHIKLNNSSAAGDLYGSVAYCLWIGLNGEEDFVASERDPEWARFERGLRTGDLKRYPQGVVLEPARDVERCEPLLLCNVSAVVMELTEQMDAGR